MAAGAAPRTSAATDRPMDHRVFRRHFPLLSETSYLAACSLAARSTDLDAAIGEMLARMTGGDVPWPQFEERLDRARRRFATLIGADGPEIAALPNASVCAYQVAAGFDWSRRPRIVTCHAEFPSIAHVWLAQRPRGATVSFAGSPDRAPTAADYEALLDDRTALVSVPMVGYRDAARLPVAEIATSARRAGARVFTDAYQALGTEPVDVDRLGCDYLAGGTMKYLLGLPGIAFLYERTGSVAGREPELTGWFGRVDPFAFDPHTLDFASGARRYEIGTPAVAAAYAADAGLGLIGRLDLTAVRRHIDRLYRHLAARLNEAGECVRSPAEHGAHVAVQDPNAARTAAELADRNVAVSPRGDLIRLSMHFYNNLDDADRAYEELAACRRQMRGR